MNKELIIIGDVIKSRKKFHPNNWAFFHDSIDCINKNFNSSLKIPFSVYSGDSFGAVCKDLTSALEIVLAIQEFQRHQNSRIILIEDEVTFGMEKNNFLALEGPALWRSEEKLKQAKKNNVQFLADIDIEDQLITKITNTIVNLILAIRVDWNDTEWAIYKKYNHTIKQTDIAKDLNISQQYVSKLIRKSHIKLIKSSEKKLQAIVGDIMQKSA